MVSKDTNSNPFDRYHRRLDSLKQSQATWRSLGRGKQTVMDLRDLWQEIAAHHIYIGGSSYREVERLRLAILKKMAYLSQDEFNDMCDSQGSMTLLGDLTLLWIRLASSWSRFRQWQTTRRPRTPMLPYS